MRSAQGAWVNTAARYRTGAELKNSVTNSIGFAKTVYRIPAVSYVVPVVVKVAKGNRSGTCATAFAPTRNVSTPQPPPPTASPAPPAPPAIEDAAPYGAADIGRPIAIPYGGATYAVPFTAQGSNVSALEVTSQGITWAKWTIHANDPAGGNHPGNIIDPQLPFGVVGCTGSASIGPEGIPAISGCPLTKNLLYWMVLEVNTSPARLFPTKATGSYVIAQFDGFEWHRTTLLGGLDLGITYGPAKPPTDVTYWTIRSVHYDSLSKLVFVSASGYCSGPGMLSLAAWAQFSPSGPYFYSTTQQKSCPDFQKYGVTWRLSSYSLPVGFAPAVGTLVNVGVYGSGVDPYTPTFSFNNPSVPLS